jgi:4-amino-4-deoxy-L-arabinose transferase-like glycosyltransferase
MKPLPDKSPVSPGSLWPGTMGQRGLLVAILLVAAYLRLAHIGVMLWGGDPSDATLMAVRLAQGEEWPRHGLMFSVGVWQPPLVIYLMSPFMMFSQDPTWFPRCWAVVCTGAVFLCFLIGKKFFSERIGLVAAALFAVAPWPVMFSRQAWCQGIVHGIAVALLWFWCRFLTEKRPWHLFWIVLLTLFMGQIHLAAVALIVLIVVAWLVLRFPLYWKPIMVAIGINVLTIVPYIDYQMEHHWEDFQRTGSVMKSFNEYQPYSIEGIHPQYGFPFPSRKHFEHILNLSSGRQFEELNGLSTPKFNSLAGMSLLNGLSLLEMLAILGAVVALGVYLVRQATGSRRFPYFDLSHEPLLTLLFLWMIVSWVFFHATGIKSYVLYFSFIFPVPFMLLAWGYDRLQKLDSPSLGHWVHRLTRIGLPIVLGSMVVGQAVFVERLYRFWDEEGGALGTRCEAYKHEVAAVDHIVARAPSKNPVVSADWPPQTPVHHGIQYLLWWKLRDRALPVAIPAGQAQTAFVVYDTRFKKPGDVPSPLDRLPSAAFGPLRVYELPLTARLPAR